MRTRKGLAGGPLELDDRIRNTDLNDKASFGPRVLVVEDPTSVADHFSDTTEDHSCHETLFLVSNT